MATAPALQLPDVEAMTAEEALLWAYEQFGDRMCLTCSWQRQSSVLVHMVFGELGLKIPVVELDTQLFFKETYELWREVEQRYETKVEVFEGPAPDVLAATHGDELWERKPDLYLALAKVEPLVRALGDLDAWITGIRRDQSPTRANALKLGWDATHELW